MRALDSTYSRIRSIFRKCDTPAPCRRSARRIERHPHYGVPFVQSTNPRGLTNLAGNTARETGDASSWSRAAGHRLQTRDLQTAPCRRARNTARHGSGRVGRKRQRQGDLSLPLLTYNALGGLRQDPGRGAESSAGAATCGNWGHDVRVLLSAHAGAGVRAARLGGTAGRLDRGEATKMRTRPTRGSTTLAAPVIRSASAMRWSTAASEVSQ